MPIKVVRKPHRAWKRYMANRIITAAPQPMVSAEDRFFVMGSCFADEIRIALEKSLGPAHVLPELHDTAPTSAPAALPTGGDDGDDADGEVEVERGHFGTYNAYSVLQEVERILNLWQPAADDYWQLDGKVQCPYRRTVFAETPEALAALTATLDTVLRQGFEAADHFIFTFGMTEVFVNRVSGKIANQKPGYGYGGGRVETDYHRASFAENLAVMEKIVDLISSVKPKAKIFVTVSPVPLKRTFSGEDIYVANSLSKCTLRAVLGELAQSRKDSVVYFPSYETVMSSGHDAWEADGRHVRRPLVEQITRSFREAYFHDQPTKG
jgi:hypothetical protein